MDETTTQQAPTPETPTAPIAATREDFMRAAKLENHHAEPADVDFGDGVQRRVWVRGMTLSESVQFHLPVAQAKQAGEPMDPQTVMGRLLAFAVCGEDRQRLFTEDDVEWLATIPGTTGASELVEKARRLNKL